MSKPIDSWDRYGRDGWKLDFFDVKTSGFLVIHPNHGWMELPQNQAVGRILAELGDAIVLLPNIEGRRSPDALRNDVEWEFKQVFNAQNVARAIEHALRRGKYQSPSLLCFLPTDYPKNEITKGIFNAVKFDVDAHIQLVAILFSDKKLVEFGREEILDGSFTGHFY